ncbi:MAG TPA: M14 family zinc carboxypeptidase, partial [Acidobacteriaceae bacterium]|nr:M14 family zinc carboxypeptidase [Acidobacteriaceae bacterium]
MSRSFRIMPVLALLCFNTLAALAQVQDYARDPHQAIDESYTAAIRKYTTEPEFNSPLTDYLPASKNVPTPAKVLGDVAGAPNMLPYAEDVYKYFRELAAASPRVRVVTIGHSEEGREMIAVAIADESILAHQKENDDRLAKLGDPRTLDMDDAKAAPLIAQSTPVYYITGTIHSTETGAPTALMELAYRLAVDDSPYIQYIRSHVITLITPVVEVDGRDRMVDVYRWHRAHPDETYPHLPYWGHYVAHDNNRDAMTMNLALTRNVLNTYIGWHAQVLHDLHESVPFLYDNTVGDGPYNSWIDPILTNEWQLLGWSNVQAMAKLNMPGVFTHGDFDTWSPGYLMFLGAMHNGISRLYETFGNGGADTVERILTPAEYARTWYKPNPPLPKVLWSQRDNNNYEETALLTTLSYFAQNSKLFLDNYYLKSKRSILKPAQNGPAAYVLTADDPSPSRQAMLLRVLHDQHIEIQQTTAAVTVQLPQLTPPVSDKDDDAKVSKPKPPTSRTFPAGSYVIRMDQPYSRIADALLDRQFWSPEDPQKTPYDDTGWSLPPLFGVDSARILDTAILKTPMQLVANPTAPFSTASLSGDTFLIENHADPSLITLRYQLAHATITATDAGMTAGGHAYPAGTWIVRGISGSDLEKAANPLHLHIVAASDLPNVAAHPVPAPRIALMHTWLDTQPEGWWRLALDNLRVPYAYISTQTVAAEPDLRSKYDIILFAPVGHNSQFILNGIPMWGNAMPWQKSDLTPNLGRIDSTPDIRPGLGEAGLTHLRDFIQQGGLFIASQDAAEFAINTGLAPGVSITPRGSIKVVGTTLNTVLVSKKDAPSSPILAGYASAPAVYSENGMSFNVSSLLTGDDSLRAEAKKPRPTGRGGPDDPDVPQDRSFAAPPPLPNAKPWEPIPLTVEQTRNNPFVIPKPVRPQVLLRYADAKNLLVA